MILPSMQVRGKTPPPAQLAAPTTRPAGVAPKTGSVQSHWLNTNTALKAGSEQPPTGDFANGARTDSLETIDAASIKLDHNSSRCVSLSNEQLVAEIIRTQGARLRRLRRSREATLAMADWLSTHVPDERELIDKLRQCAQSINFIAYDNASVRTQFRTCKQFLLCPLCGFLRSVRSAANYTKLIAHALDADQSLQAYFVTLTVAAGDGLSAKLFHLRQSVKALHARRKGYRSGKRGRTEAALIEGGVGSVDLNWWNPETWVRGEPLVWHLHLHEIWLCKTAPDERKLAREWREITRDSYKVQVKTIHGADLPGTPEEKRERLASNVWATLRYSTKFGWNVSLARWHAYKALKSDGRRLPRLVTSYGILRGQHLPDETEGDQPEPVAHTVYTWSDEKQEYGNPAVFEPSVTLRHKPTGPCPMPGPVKTSEITGGQ